MKTGLINSWTNNVADLGPLYPFVGWEMALFIGCLILWIVYTFWQLRFEQKHFEREEREILQQGPGRNFQD